MIEINPEYSLEGTQAEAEAPILWPPDGKSCVIGKDSDAGKAKGENEMVGWHHQHNDHEFEQTPGDSKRQGSLASYSLWGQRVRHD